MKKLSVLLLSILALTSCKLSQHYTFNTDFSGLYQLKFDMTDMANYGVEDPDSVPNVFEGFNVDSVQDIYEQMDGLSKVDVKAEKNVLYVSYKFEDLTALNASLATQNSSEFGLGASENSNKFSNEKGVFKYQFTDDSETATPDSIAQMMSFIDYEITMEFAKQIDEASNGIIDENRKRIDLSGNLGEVAAKEKSLNLEVTFKK